jgi:hypothetical protein
LGLAHFSRQPIAGSIAHLPSCFEDEGRAYVAALAVRGHLLNSVFFCALARLRSNLCGCSGSIYPRPRGRVN